MKLFITVFCLSCVFISNIYSQGFFVPSKEEQIQYENTAKRNIAYNFIEKFWKPYSQIEVIKNMNGFPKTIEEANNCTFFIIPGYYIKQEAENFSEEKNILNYLYADTTYFLCYIYFNDILLGIMNFEYSNSKQVWYVKSAPLLLEMKKLFEFDTNISDSLEKSILLHEILVKERNAGNYFFTVIGFGNIWLLHDDKCYVQDFITGEFVSMNEVIKKSIDAIQQWSQIKR